MIEVASIDIIDINYYNYSIDVIALPSGPPHTTKGHHEPHQTHSILLAVDGEAVQRMPYGAADAAPVLQPAASLPSAW